MKKQLKQRLQQLEIEFESGRKLLTDLQTRETEVQKSLLRISGAIQVLEEELSKADESDNNGAASEPEASDAVETEAEVLATNNGN